MHGPDERGGKKRRKEKKHRPVALQTLSSNPIPVPHALMSALLQIHLRSAIFETSKKRIFKLQLEASLISQGPTLIFTAPVYTKDGLSQKTSLQYFVLWDDLRLVSSFGLQSLKSYIILQACYWPYIKDKISQRYNKIHTSIDRQAMSTHLHI